MFFKFHGQKLKQTVRTSRRSTNRKDGLDRLQKQTAQHTQTNISAETDTHLNRFLPHISDILWNWPVCVLKLEGT